MLREVTHDRSLRDLANALAAGLRRRSAEADRIEELVAEGLLEEAGIAVTRILLALRMGEGGGCDLAAVRVTTALTLANVARRNREDVDLGLGALDSLVAKVGPEAATLGEARMREVADALDAAGEHDVGRRAQEIAERFAKSHDIKAAARAAGSDPT